ncbi:MAG TPA: aminoacyl-tRNA hydrolase [Bacteroidota bacterium]|nr:aminoacyl-tRNA hydrolase [Bacteroidota bacterium]
MYLIVGLGNPGSEYDGTRHNIGFDVVEKIAADLRIRFHAHRLHRSAAGRKYGADIVLSQPRIYMNNSGEAVRSLLAEHGLPPERLIVCCDDLHLPLGAVRLRKKGGGGGHNGLLSVIREIGGAEFPRLRCGIRGAGVPGPGQATAGYVLSTFEPGELSVAAEMAERAADSVMMIVRDGIDRAMNAVNTK